MLLVIFEFNRGLQWVCSAVYPQESPTWFRYLRQPFSLVFTVCMKNNLISINAHYLNQLSPLQLEQLYLESFRIKLLRPPFIEVATEGNILVSIKTLRAFI